MGRTKVIEEALQKPITTDSRWLAVTFEPVETFRTPISLTKIKSIPDLTQIALVKQPRFAVSQVNEDELNFTFLSANDCRY